MRCVRLSPLPLNNQSPVLIYLEHTHTLPPPPPPPPRTHWQTFECSSDDLLEEVELGRGAYGAVYRMKHKPTGTVMAVKVRFHPDLLHSVLVAASSIQRLVWLVIGL